MNTGWIKYRFGSAASAGTWQYVYAPYYCSKNVRKEDTEEFLIEREVWPRYQEHYRGCEMELNVLPPIELVHKEIMNAERKIDHLKLVISRQQELFDKLLEVN